MSTVFFLLVVSFFNIGSEVQSQSITAATFDAYVQRVNAVAAGASSDTSIDCQALLTDITAQIDHEDSASCEEKYNDDNVNNTMVVKMDWANMYSRELSCVCGLGMIQTLSAVDVVELANSGSNVCAPNGTIACSSICPGSVGNGTSFSCEASTRCDLCLLYGTVTHEIELQGAMIQIVALVDGIACRTLANYSSDICRFTSVGTDNNNHTSLYALIFGLVLGLTLSIILFTFIVVLVACICRRRKKKQSYNFRNDSIMQTVVINGGLPEHYSSKCSSFAQESLSYRVDSLNHQVDSLAKYRQLFASLLVQPSDYKILEEVGEGAFGKVYKGILFNANDNQVDVAIKTLKDPTPEQVEEFISESAIMLDFDHPNILSLLGVCFDTEQNLPLIILPYMANGDLKSYLVKCRGDNEPYALPTMLTSKDLLMMCLDIARGMSYLAQKRFIHRDLAARNCMIDEDLNVQVADFGFSRDIYSRDYYRLERKTRLPVKWLPPESLLDNKYDVKTDIWSFGVVCWEVFSLGRAPYPGLDNADIPEYIIAGKRLKQPVLCPDEMFSMISECWNYVPGERPSFDEIVSSLEKKLVEIHDALALGEEMNSSVIVQDKPYFTLEAST